MTGRLELFPFQEFSVNYLVDKRAVLIGDEMGLGKSLQAVTLDTMRRNKHPNLVKNPKTLVVTYLGIFSSWQEHFQQQTNLRVSVIDPKNRKPFLLDIFTHSADVFIVHWQVLRLIPELAAIEWLHIIADECHALQNRKARQTEALKKLKTFYKTGLSGTPAYDKPDDLWSILNWLYPTYWSSFWRYWDDHVLSIDQDGYKVVIGVKDVEKLQNEMRGFYIRRKKADVLLDLPDKYYTEMVVDLHPKQKRAYDQMKKDMLAWIGEHEDEPVAAKAVITQLMRLQQFSDAYGEIEVVKKRTRLTEEECVLWKQPPGSFKDIEVECMRLSEPSTKLDAVMQILASTDAQLVVFSQFSQVIELLGKRLESAGIPHGIFIGKTSTDDRARIISGFQSGKLQVFAGTIAAGGIGITLTAASTVVFVDRSWSASLNIQAEDRCHRIGQKSAVQIIDIISRHTLDMKRIQKINLQWSWIKQLIGDDDVEEGVEDYAYDDTDW